MAWKIYFFILTLLLLMSYALIFSGAPNVWDFIDVFESTLVLMGVFSYSFKKSFFPDMFWKFALLVFIIWDITYNFSLSSYLQVASSAEYQTGLIEHLIGWAFIVPAYVAIYKLGNPPRTEQFI